MHKYTSNEIDGKVPRSVIVIGSGVFGLTTALSLAARPKYSTTNIIVIDKSIFPARDGSSIDSSRIVRADYSDAAYSKLAAEAQNIWRGNSSGADDDDNDSISAATSKSIYHGVGSDGRYNESGLVLVSQEGTAGEQYVRNSYQNVKQNGFLDSSKIQWLNNREEVRRVCQTGGTSGSNGYVNWGSGWADAEASMRWVRERCGVYENIHFIHKKVHSLKMKNKDVVEGVVFDDRSILMADLTILAAGAWSAELLNLQGRAVSTGQALGYIDVTPVEEEKYKNIPVLLNLHSGLFIIPPRNGVLKVARHAFGYTNHVSTIINGEKCTISQPITELSHTGCCLPSEGEKDLRRAVEEMIPEFADRPFSRTRLCWYTDTPTADFIIAYHPTYKGLFVATGGSGHAFKFLPCLGEKIVDSIEHNTPVEFQTKWAWRKDKSLDLLTKDGSRGGQEQLELEVLFKKDGKVLSKL